MTTKPLPLTPELHAYLVAHGSAPDEIVRELAEETRAALPAEAVMQVAPEQAAFLTFLTRLLGVRQAVEVGTFTGLSSLAIARGLAEGGRLTCFDISEEYTGVARRYWERAGVQDRIELRIGPAAETLRELPRERYLDFAFIDADKVGYPIYWDELVPRMRPGAVIAVDNTLRDGRVLARHGRSCSPSPTASHSPERSEPAEHNLAEVAASLSTGCHHLPETETIKPRRPTQARHGRSCSPSPTASHSPERSEPAEHNLAEVAATLTAGYRHLAEMAAIKSRGPAPAGHAPAAR